MQTQLGRMASVCAWALLSACSGIKVSEEGYRHMLCVDANGDPRELDVQGARGPSKKQDHPTHAEEIAAAYREFRYRTGSTRILLVIHGGLVPLGAAVQEAEAVLRAMATVPTNEPSFPIFVNWETGLGASYLDHLFLVRYGRAHPTTAVVTSPFLLVADAGRAVARYPLTLWKQVENLRAYYLGGTIQPVPRGWEATARLDCTDDSPSALEYSWNVVREFVPGLFRLVTTPLVDGAGVSAYQDMLRRARVLFLRDQDFDGDDNQPSGALPCLMEALAGQKAHPPQITIVAHSMGAVVANDLIARYGGRKFPAVRGQPDVLRYSFPEIVYMGAACTVQDWAHTALPYIREHPNVRFYNLCLHPRDEADDRYFGGVLPHGSLLEWIDDYITNQETALDRTLGKWNNVMDALPLVDWLPVDVRARIVVRGFPRVGGTPHDHGEFNDVRQQYWRREFWDWRQPAR